MSYQKILDRRKKLRDDNLSLELQNNANASVYNKDLFNGVIQMQQDTRTRYEIENDSIEQETICMNNLKKIFNNDNSEIGKSLTYLKNSTNYMLIFNKYYTTIYRDLNGIYNLMAKDFQKYYERFYQKIIETKGVDQPAQESTLAQVQENINQLKDETTNANDNIKDIVLDSLDVKSLNIKATYKNYITSIIELNDLYIATADPDLRNDMDALGLTDNFINYELPTLGDPAITIQQQEDIMAIVKQCKAVVMKKLFKKYGSPAPTTTTAPTKSMYRDEEVIPYNGTEYVIFGKYLYEIDPSTGLFNNMPALQIDNSDNIISIRTTKPMISSIDVDDFNTAILNSRVVPPPVIPPPVIPPPMTLTPAPTTYYNDEHIYEVRSKKGVLQDSYIVFDNFGYKQLASGEYETKPVLTFDGVGKKIKISKASLEYKNFTNNQKLLDYKALTGLGLKKSLNTDKIMKILKKLQMKKITGGFVQPNYDKIKFMKDIKKDNIKGGMSKYAAQQYALEYYRR